MSERESQDHNVARRMETYLSECVVGELDWRASTQTDFLNQAMRACGFVPKVSEDDAVLDEAVRWVTVHADRCVPRLRRTASRHLDLLLASRASSSSSSSSLGRGHGPSSVSARGPRLVTDGCLVQLRVDSGPKTTQRWPRLDLDDLAHEHDAPTASERAAWMQAAAERAERHVVDPHWRTVAWCKNPRAAETWAQTHIRDELQRGLRALVRGHASAPSAPSAQSAQSAPSAPSPIRRASIVSNAVLVRIVHMHLDRWTRAAARRRRRQGQHASSSSSSSSSSSVSLGPLLAREPVLGSSARRGTDGRARRRRLLGLFLEHLVRETVGGHGVGGHGVRRVGRVGRDSFVLAASLRAACRRPRRPGETLTTDATDATDATTIAMVPWLHSFVRLVPVTAGPSTEDVVEIH